MFSDLYEHFGQERRVELTKTYNTYKLIPNLHDFTRHYISFCIYYKCMQLNWQFFENIHFLLSDLKASSCWWQPAGEQICKLVRRWASSFAMNNILWKKNNNFAMHFRWQINTIYMKAAGNNNKNSYGSICLIYMISKRLFQLWFCLWEICKLLAHFNSCTMYNTCCIIY